MNKKTFLLVQKVISTNENVFVSPLKDENKQLTNIRHKSRLLFLWLTELALNYHFLQLEEDERRLSKLSIRDEEVGLQSDEEETGMILKETKYQTTRLQKTI